MRCLEVVIAIQILNLRYSVPLQVLGLVRAGDQSFPETQWACATIGSRQSWDSILPLGLSPSPELPSALAACNQICLIA